MQKVSKNAVKLFRQVIPIIFTVTIYTVIFFSDAVFFNNLFTGKYKTFYQANIVLAKNHFTTGSAIFYIREKEKAKKNSKIFVTIKPNQTLNSIATTLIRYNMIQVRIFFVLVSKFTYYFTKKYPQIGEYIIDSSISQHKLILQMQNKNSVLRKIYIPSGSSAYQVEQIIKNSYGLFGEMPFLQEGSVLPETYCYTYGTSKKFIISKMQQYMSKALQMAYEIFLQNMRKVYGIQHLTENEFLILASIVEKEATDQDREIISGVFLNRITQNKRIEACSTVIYEITHGKSHLRSISIRDTKTSHKLSQPTHNTYIIKGLPRTPICNPSKHTLLATANFHKTDMMFFTWNADKKNHEFSRDFKQHKSNKFAAKSSHNAQQNKAKRKSTPLHSTLRKNIKKLPK